MYRSYENPHELQDKLDALLARYADTSDVDELVSLSCEIAELKDRIRFAWDDEENG